MVGLRWRADELGTRRAVSDRVFHLPMLVDEVRARVDRLELPFNAHGVDPYGISKRHLVVGMSLLVGFYKYYFSVEAFGAERVPARGRAMLVGNHSGGLAIDGAMVIASMFIDKDPPRLAQGMIEKFMGRLPVSALWSSRMGQFTGLPEHALRLLEDDRLLMVFPEGVKGTAKLYRDRYSLVDFGTGFMRLALRTKTPIVPLAFLGGGDAVPTIANAYTLGKLVGLPYVPLTPYGAPLPLPVRLQVYYGEPMQFDGSGDEDDAVIFRYVSAVKERIQDMMDSGVRARRGTR